MKKRLKDIDNIISETLNEVVSKKVRTSLFERTHFSGSGYKQLLSEADSRFKVVDRIINQVFSKYFNPDDVVTSEEYYVNGNQNTTWRQYLIFNLRHTFGLMGNQDVKYLPVVARLAYSDQVKFDITNDNARQVKTLGRIVELFKKDANLFNEVRSNENITFNDLYNRFKDVFAKEDAEIANKANSVKNNGTSEYTVVEVPDFETAKYYGKYSCSTSRLCYTDKEHTWNDYTNNGINKVYVCLRNGWKDIPEVPTEGNPYDLYGTSMIFVFISPDGEIVTSNCRWNHETVGPYNGSVDHAFNPETLSKTIGMPFNSVFKPFEIDENAIRKAIERGDNKLLKSIAVGDFVVPEGVTYIGNSAFWNCIGLTSINIPNSVTEIGESAFRNCRGLTNINIPESITIIDDYAFCDCKSFTSIIIPESVTEIGYGVFCECASLTSVTIPNSVTEIGEDAFCGCIGLASINIPNSVTKIGVGAFSNCSGLTSISIPGSVTVIAYGAFYGCKSLTSISIPNSVTKIGVGAFCDCTGLTSVTIPNSVTKIREDAFRGCIGLTSINIPESVTGIEMGAFCDCTGLTSVTIPNSVTEIEGGAFRNCRGLTSISIPGSVTVIVVGAFRNCTNLTVYVTSEETAKLVRRCGFKGNVKYTNNQINEIFSLMERIDPQYKSYKQNKQLLNW